jgi:phosphohistidine phosphatase
MILYLIRHGEAASSQEDPKRGLTKRGRNETEEMAERLKARGVAPEVVWHSGKTRAAETAKILADNATERKGLNPDDPVGPILKDIESLNSDLMIVGHLPFLGILASRLLAGSHNAETVVFPPSGVTALERTPETGWKLLWTISQAS